MSTQHLFPFPCDRPAVGCWPCKTHNLMPVGGRPLRSPGLNHSGTRYSINQYILPCHIQEKQMRRTLFTEEHHLFRDAFKHFLEKEVVPYYEQWEKDGIVSREMWRKAGQQGFLGLAVPEAYGGSGVDDFRYSAIMAEESARAGVISAGMVIG